VTPWKPLKAAPLAAAALALPLAGCLDEPLGAPKFSAVGEGLTVTRTTIPTAVPLSLAGNPNSIYGRQGRELLTDVRASDVGDVVTVVVVLNDLAEFENESEREKRADSTFDFEIFAEGQGFDGPPGAAEAVGGLGIGSTSRFRGEGTIDRSERLRLRVAAIVTEVLPNGYLVIAGKQEIRVNAEMRVLELAGIVNPLDVTRDNTVDYARIAEARISYGGRGTVSEIQAPNWGQRIYDRVVPF
jgi:flagellar L-ring protein precursor FlgH